VKPRDIDRFFEDLGERLDRPIQVVITGGAAAILQGTSRATFDIDFEVRLKKTSLYPAGWEAVQKAIEDTSQATGIAAQYSEDIDRWSSIAMPSRNSRLYRRFRKIEVRLLDPAVWAIGKLARYLASDIQDLRTVLKKEDKPPKLLVKLWGRALGISPASSSQSTFRRQVESFLENYAREIWGSKTDVQELQRVFLRSTRAARPNALHARTTKAFKARNPKK
jgi:hypothetical protein